MSDIRLVKKGNHVEIAHSPESPIEREVKLFWQGVLSWDRMSTAGRFLVETRLESSLSKDRAVKPTVESIFGHK